jgi:unsaturated chondroitin disaccharide hydrolase
MCTFGNQLRFDRDSGFDAARQLLLDAARTMSLRYHADIGALSSNWDSWDDPRSPSSIPVVIDIMMNLELLYWASENGGDPAWADMATQHAITTWEDLIRPDGGSYHVVRYDATSGERLDQGQLQGESKESTWSRGHAWALYGFTVCHRYTGRTEMLDHARVLFDYFLSHLPEDGIAPWDFQSANRARDVSATAITTSALFEFASMLKTPEERRHYWEEGTRLLLALCQEPWFITDPDSPCLLDDSTQYLPWGQNIERAAIFADYYFLEALHRHHQGLPEFQCD